MKKLILYMALILIASPLVAQTKYRGIDQGIHGHPPGDGGVVHPGAVVDERQGWIERGVEGELAGGVMLKDEGALVHIARPVGPSWVVALRDGSV